MASAGRPRRVLIIVENMPVPFDRRVWTEASTLREDGYEVSIICPKGKGATDSYTVIDGIHIFRHPLPWEARRALGYPLEYMITLFWEFLLSWKVFRKRGFDVIHACNPPDLIFLVGAFYKFFYGKRFIFDHHDLNPELFEAKFGKRGFFYRLLCLLERWTFYTADKSIATNERFKIIAIERGRMKPDDVFVVRSVPDLKRFKRMPAKEELRNGRQLVVGYVGIMGTQDGVDNLVLAVRELVEHHSRTDIQCVIVGDGTELATLKELTERVGMSDYVHFTSFLSGDDLLRTLSTFDIGVIPDPTNSYNDKISMNKVFEYMALEIPFVQFDLSESREAAGDAGQTVPECTPQALAYYIAQLADDPEQRTRMAAAGKRRTETLFQWKHEQAELLKAYRRALD